MMRVAAGVLVLRVLLFTYFLFIGNAWAKTVYVAQDAAGDASGSSWINAATTIKAGLALSASGDEVWVKAGTYREPVIMPEGVALRGGFAGSESDLTQRAWRVNRSIIAGATNTQYGNARIARILSTSESKIDGFTIPGNESDYEMTSASVSIFYCANVMIQNCTVTVGIEITQASALILQCTFTRDYSYFSPIILGQDVSVQVNDCLFKDNGYNSGSIKVYSYDNIILRCHGCRFIGNNGNGSAGISSLHGYLKYLEVLNCEFYGNSASAGHTQPGDDIWFKGDKGLIKDCTFTCGLAYRHNSIRSWGMLDIIGCSFTGYYYCILDSIKSLKDCVFKDNQASAFNGCVFSVDGCIFEKSGYSALCISETPYTIAEYTINNCIFTENMEAMCGYFRKNDLKITNCVVTNNYSFGTIISSTRLHVANSIIWRNTSEFNYDDATITYTDIEGGCPGIGNIDADPMFVYPRMTNESSYDLHLLPSSPCIDSGSNQFAADIPADLDGHTRIWDGDDIPGAIVDMGPYEYGAPPVQVDADNNKTIDYLDLFLFASHWEESVADSPGNGDMDKNGYINGDDLPPLLEWLRE